MKWLQRLGRSLMLPVAVLPAAALLTGIGYWIDPAGWGSGNPVASFLISAGNALLANIRCYLRLVLPWGWLKSAMVLLAWQVSYPS